MSVPARLRFYSKLREQPFIVLKEVPHEMVQRASYCNTSTPMSGGAAAWNVHKRGVFFVLRQEKLGKGGRDVTITSETFRRNSVGNQSHPAKSGQQPEASLAPRRGNPPDEA